MVSRVWLRSILQHRISAIQRAKRLSPQAARRKVQRTLFSSIKMALTTKELAAERRYLKDERAGMITDGTRELTPDEDYYLEIWLDGEMKRIEKKNE